MDSYTYYDCFYATIINYLEEGYENYYIELKNMTKATRRFRITQGGQFSVSVYFTN